jgi:cytochrome c oxidase subunit II
VRLFFLACLLPLAAVPARAQYGRQPDVRVTDGVPQPFRDVGLDQRLDAQVPLDLEFRDETGRAVRLGDYFRGKPVILVLAYYRCPMLCTQVLNGLLDALRGLPFVSGNEFQIVTVSFDPRETPELAAAKKKSYVEGYGRPGAEEGWHFLTGQQPAIDRLTQAVGFRSHYDARQGQFAHASGIMLVTPQGRLARYLYGTLYKVRDLRLGLVEASENKIGTPGDQILLYCYHYDPETGTYRAAMNMVRVGGIVTVLALGLFVVRNWEGKRKKAKGKSPEASCSSLFPFSFFLFPYAFDLPLFPEQASTVAGRVDAVFFYILGVSLFFTLLIAGLLLYFAIRYRRRSEDEVPTPIKGSLRLEAFWIVVPLALALVMFVWSSSVYLAMQEPPGEAVEVYVVGKQWMWKLQHPEGQREINELHIPVGQPVRLIMTSEDVIHSFFVPDFRTKQDVLPGRYTTTWFQATRPGRYHLFCAEYCGTGHSQMVGWVTALEPAEFQAWLASHAEGSMALEGRKIFLKYQCVTCHSADAQARAPVLEGLYGRQVPLQDGRSVRADENYLRESILQPTAKVVAGYQPIMPTFTLKTGEAGQGQLTEEELLQLIAFIKALGPGQTPRRVEESAPPELKGQGSGVKGPQERAIPPSKQP